MKTDRLLVAGVFLLLVVGCSTEPPVARLEAVFDAADTEAFEALQDFCDPQGENDVYTQRICDIATSETYMEEFASHFSRAKVNGDVRWNEDSTRAEIPFSIHLEESRQRTMELVKRDTAWYLYRMNVVP